MPRPKQRTPELKAHILQCALELLEQEGVLGFKARTLAKQAGTSLPALYELFGDKSGMVQAMFFEGFRRLSDRLQALDVNQNPKESLKAVLFTLQQFMRDHPELGDVMFSRPFADFHPSKQELKAGACVRETIVGKIQACIDTGLIQGDATDIAHVYLCLGQGLLARERAGLLGSTKENRTRRWELAFEALFHGLRAE